MENTKFTIVKACAPAIDMKVGMLPVSLHFVLPFPALQKFDYHSK